MVEVKINFVGRGNWSEIKFEINNVIYEILYDIGFSIKKIHYETEGLPQLFTPENVINNNPLVNLKKSKNSKTVRVLIISHWDLDHYSVIQELTDEELNFFDKVYAPEAHTSKTSHDIIRWMDDILGSRLNLVKQGPRVDGGVQIINEKSFSFSSFNSLFKVGLYKTTYSQSKNNGGLIFTMHVGKTLLVFSGDHHYLSLKRCFEHEDLTSIRDVVIIVPHHGGLAGSLNDFLDLMKENKIKVTWYLSSGIDHEFLKEISYERTLTELKNHHPRKSVIEGIGDYLFRTLDIKKVTSLNVQGRNIKIEVNEKGEIKNLILPLNIFS